MKETKEQLIKKGISNIKHIDEKTKSKISSYVAMSLYTKLPALKLDFYALIYSIHNLDMYVANINIENVKSYYSYEDSAIYFQNGMSTEEMQKKAVGECIHYLQEIRNKKGKLIKFGAASSLDNKEFAEIFNEYAIQLITDYVNEEKEKDINQFGIILKSNDSVSSPLLYGLVKQISHLIGNEELAISTFYSNDDFINSSYEKFGKANVNEIAKSISKFVEKELKFDVFTSGSKRKVKAIKKSFLHTQDLIYTSFFDNEGKNIYAVNDCNEFRRKLYSYVEYIGKADDYNAFNQYYIKKMVELGEKQEKATKNSLAVIKKSKFRILLQSLGNITKRNVENQETVMFK